MNTEDTKVTKEANRKIPIEPVIGQPNHKLSGFANLIIARGVVNNRTLGGLRALRVRRVVVFPVSEEALNPYRTVPL